MNSKNKSMISSIKEGSLLAYQATDGMSCIVQHFILTAGPL